MSYHRESWMMEKDEKMQTVPVLHTQGNALVKQRRFAEAASKYKEAVLLLKTVQSRVSGGADADVLEFSRILGFWDISCCFPGGGGGGGGVFPVFLFCFASL